MEVCYATAAGKLTRFLTAGRGRPLILLHALGFSADTYFRNIDSIGAAAKVYAPDLLGHGFTDFVDLSGTAPHGVMVDHIASLADVLGIDRFSIGGSSFGAQIAMQLYLRMPERVDRLVVIGSGSAFSTEEEINAALKQTAANALSALDEPTWESCRNRIARLCFDAHTRADELILSQLTSYARPGMVQMYRQVIGGMTDPTLARPWRVRERLAEFKVPALIIWGREDMRGPHHRAVEAASIMKNARLVTFERCGHLPYLEHPHLFNEAVIDFLRSS